MNNLIKASNLNINSWLINWGYLNGYLKDGKIEPTKFVKFVNWSFILINSFNAIKWLILLFSDKKSKMNDYLGDMVIFFGPKVALDFMMVLTCITSLILGLLFNFASKHSQKMLYWLDQMEFDNENRCYKKLDLNQSDSMMIIKRMSLFMFGLKWFMYSFIPLLVVVTCFCAFQKQRKYFINYCIST